MVRSIVLVLRNVHLRLPQKGLSSSFELSDLERYRAIKLIAMLFINITVFKDVCKRVSFVG